MNVIVDIDGTIADCRHRRHFVNDGNSDWTAFFDAMKDDTPIRSVINIVNSLYYRNQIILVTGRPESYRSHTIKWLRNVDVSYHYLFMREDDYTNQVGQRGTPWDFKEEVLINLRRAGVQINLALEDKQECVDMWRRNGVVCLQNSMKEMP